MSTSGKDLVATLAGRAYTDESVFAAEQERIFETQWYYVGRAEDVPTRGTFLRRQVGRERVIVVRGRDGVLRGFLNVCRHRGAQLCRTDQGALGNAIRCPYHAWTYGLDGKLITAPNWEAMADLDRASYGLHPVQLEVWEGLIWVTFAADPTPVTDVLLPQIEARLGDVAKFERYRMGELRVGARVEYEVAANWKLIYENFQECYHCGTIHPELVETVPAFRSASLGTAGYGTNGFEIAEDRASFSLSGTTTLPRLPGLADEDDRRYYGMVLTPNCFLSLVSDHVIVHRFEPLSPGRTRAVCEWLFPAETLAAGEHDVSDAVELFSRVNEQDFAAAEWCQPNMASRAYRDGGVLVPSEAPVISQFYGWYRSLMGAQ